MKKYAFGVDVGGTSIKMGLFTESGEILEKWEIPTASEKGIDAIFPNIAEEIKESMRRRSISVEEVMGVGMGVPASVSEDGHMAKAVNIGWDEMYPARELEKLTGFSVKVTNDANAAAYGEMWKGAAKGHTDVVMVTLGTGVGGGIISNGRILSGFTGGGGEIGHIHIEDGETVPCSCGNKGCLEQYASATGIVRLAGKKLEKIRKKALPAADGISAKDVFDATKKGDETALEIVDEFGRYLAKGLGTICSVVNPEVVVIGGGVSKAGVIILDAIKPYFKNYVFPACSKVDFVLAELGNDAGICGAAGLILNHTT